MVSRGSPRGVMAKALDFGIDVSQFEFQLRYYVHFRTNMLGKVSEPPYSPSYRFDSTTTVLLEGWLWHLITHEGWYAIKRRNRNQPSGSAFMI